MRFYAMAYADVMHLPIYTFWAIYRNMRPIQAEEDRRAILAASAAQSWAMGGKVPDYFTRLGRVAQDMVEFDEKPGDGFDREGVARLRRRMGG